MDWITAILASGPTRNALGPILAAARMLLLLLNLRLAGERAGRLIALLWLSGCAMGGSAAKAPCPPVVEYTSAGQARAADEVEALPESAVVVRMISGCAVLRDQARACR